VARALVEFNAGLRPKLKKLGYLTRDPRRHERKKYGQKGARAGSQFSSDNPGGAGVCRPLPVVTIGFPIVRCRKSRFGPRAETEGLRKGMFFPLST